MIRLDSKGIDVTQAVTQNPAWMFAEDLAFPWDCSMSKHFEQFFMRMPADGRELVHKALSLDWILFPIGSQFVCPEHDKKMIPVWDIAMLGDPFNGQYCTDLPKVQSMESVMIEVPSTTWLRRVERFSFGQLVFYRLDPAMFDSFVNGNRLCLDNPHAVERGYRIDAVRSWFKTTSEYVLEEDEVPF